MKSNIRYLIVALICGSFVMSEVPTAEAKRKKKKEEPEQAPVDSLQQSKKHLSFGYRYLKNKQYKDAEIELTRSWKFNPTSPKAAYYLGRLYNETEKVEEAINWFTTAIQLNPEGTNAKNAYYFLGQLYVLQENRPEAIRVYEILLDIAQTPEKEKQYLHHLVTLYVEEEDFEPALTHTRRWGELAPGDPDVQDTIAKLALHTGEDDEALVQMEKVLEMNPEDYATLQTLAQMYVQKDMTQKAFEAYTKLHDLEPDNFLYLDQLLTLGKDLGKKQRYQNSLLRKMLKLQPNNLSVIERLVDSTGSIRLVNQGLKLDPGSGKFNYMKGQYFYDKWKKSATKTYSMYALKWFKRAKKDPQWTGNAKRMIDELDPPITEEEKVRQKFFNKTKKKEEEVDIEGKK